MVTSIAFKIGTCIIIEGIYTKKMTKNISHIQHVQSLSFKFILNKFHIFIYMVYVVYATFIFTHLSRNSFISSYKEKLSVKSVIVICMTPN